MGEVSSPPTPIGGHHHSSCRTPIRYPRRGAERARLHHQRSQTTTRTGASCGRPWGRGAAHAIHPLVMPDPDPVPTVGHGPGAATTTLTCHPQPPNSSPPTPIGGPTTIRRAGPRSGTHGGARNGRGNHHTHLSSPTPIGGPTPSSCRTPIRYPRWGTGRARQLTRPHFVTGQRLINHPPKKARVRKVP